MPSNYSALSGDRMIQVRKVASMSLLRACRRFLAQDPVSNVLPLGDLYSPLLKVSHINCAVKSYRVVGVCSIYRAFSTPSMVFGTAAQEVKQALVKKALNEISSEFISLCQPDEADLFKENSTILHFHLEQQMIANPPKQIEYGNIKVKKVRKNELELLNDFYIEHHAEAWTPIQFEAGPYYCVKQNGKIVSAVGVHLVAPQIAQLGNIITHEDYRNRGFATACTSALAAHLASKGRIISLFVRTDNAPAIRMYEKLGFSKKRNIAFLIMQKHGVKT